MKNLFLLMMIFVSVNSYSVETVLEFDEAQEKKCYVEIKAMKCTNSTGEEIQSCVEANKAKLSKECKSIHTAKMSNK